MKIVQPIFCILVRNIFRKNGFIFSIIISLIVPLQAQVPDTSIVEKKSFIQRLKSIFSPFGETEDSGMGIQFFHGEGIGTTRSFYLPGPEATFEITTYHAQGVVAPFSTYHVISEDGFGVVNGRFSVQSDFPLDESWKKNKIIARSERHDLQCACRNVPS